MKAEIIAVGTNSNRTSGRNTNAQFLSENWLV